MKTHVYMLSSCTGRFLLLTHNTGSLSSSLRTHQCPLDTMCASPDPHPCGAARTVHDTGYEYTSPPCPHGRQPGPERQAAHPSAGTGRSFPRSAPTPTGRAGCHCAPPGSRFPPRPPGRCRPRGAGGPALAPSRAAGVAPSGRNSPPAARAEASPGRGGGSGGVGGAGPARLPGRRLGLRPRTAPAAGERERRREAGGRRGAARVSRRDEGPAGAGAPVPTHSRQAADPAPPS